MPIFELFSRNQKLLREQPTDVVSYDNLPTPLRIQIVYLIQDVIGQGTLHHPKEGWYKEVVDILTREYGLYSLVNGYPPDAETEITRFIYEEEDIERVLDAVMYCMRVIEYYSNQDMVYSARLTPKQAIEDLNARFKEHAVGYRYESRNIIKLDSTYTHAAILKPTLSLLAKPMFANVNSEYLSAHEHYRHGRNKECLTDCLKAFESTLKIIFTSKGWPFSSTATASTLINVALTNNLVPSYLQSQLTALRSLLESGIPTLRNKLGGHGQGATPTSADDETARYGLNITGSNIIYLIELSNL